MKLFRRRKRRSGHEPGVCDVSTITFGQPFTARPNFYWFEGCGRPCWLPIHPQPDLSTPSGQALTKNWPCEAYYQHDRSKGEACQSDDPPDAPRDGDWVEVIGQVWGEEIRNENGEKSKIWDVIKIPIDRLNGDIHSDLMVVNDGAAVLGYAPDIWLGNTGWHAIKFKPETYDVR